MAEWPNVGIRTGEEAQAGLSMRWEENVTNSPNVAFRRVEIKVYASGHEDHALAQLVGYLGKGKN